MAAGRSRIDGKGRTVTERTIIIGQILDCHRIGALRWRVFLMCGLITLLDGFDTQAIGYVAPRIAEDFGMELSAFGAVFSASLFGLMLGAMTLGPLGDRIGRKPVLLSSFAGVGVFSLLTGFAGTSEQLILLRFLTGVGLGGTVPNAIALTAEYAPRRHRAALVTLVFAGFPLGAGLGGLAVAPLIADFGWRAVFVIGGVLPLLLCLITLRLLPESLAFLVAKQPDSLDAAVIIERIDPAYRRQHGDLFRIDEVQQGRGRWKSLFSDGRGTGTMLLWLIFFSNLLILYFILNWLPGALAREAYSLDAAIRITAVFNIGGVLGGIGLGWLVDRFGARVVLTVAFSVGAALVAMIGPASASYSALLPIVFGAGFCVVGCQFCINILAIDLYPMAIRSTGLGWAVGIGRAGAIAGPMLGALLIARAWPVEWVFVAAGLPSLFCALCVASLHRTPLPASTDAQAVSAAVPSSNNAFDK